VKSGIAVGTEIVSLTSDGWCFEVTLWYNVRMSKTLTKNRTHTGDFTLGRLAFARISAVEGIRLTPEMENDLREFDKKGLSGSERRKIILEKYAKTR